MSGREVKSPNPFGVRGFSIGELHDEVKKHRDVNWSEVVRKAIRKVLDKKEKEKEGWA